MAESKDSTPCGLFKSLSSVKHLDSENENMLSPAPYLKKNPNASYYITLCDAMRVRLCQRHTNKKHATVTGFHLQIYLSLQTNALIFLCSALY